MNKSLCPHSRDEHDEPENAVSERAIFERIVMRSNEAIIVTNHRREVVFWNPAAEEVFGYDADFMLGKDMHDFITPERYKSKAKDAHGRYLATGYGYAIGKRIEIEATHKDGSEIWVELGINDVLVAGNRWAFAVIRDISAQKAYEEQLRRQSLTDSLTKVGNRRAFQAELELYCSLGGGFSLVFIDADKLKVINDRFGHPAGDFAIKRVADVLSELADSKGRVFRLGGDEFAVLLKHASEHVVKLICNEIINSLQEQRWSEYPGMQIGVSIGATIVKESDISSPVFIRQLLSETDKRLYESKKSTRAKIRCGIFTGSSVQGRDLAKSAA